jgi:hypothetical protein
MSIPAAVTGSVMVCDKGTAMVPLVASGNASVEICGVVAAVITDVLPGANISPFGMCVITKAACSPVPVGTWINQFANDCIIGGAQSLLEGATLPCAVGGTISVMSAKQASVLVGENQAENVQALAEYMAQQMRQNAWGLLDLLRLNTVDIGPLSIPFEPDESIDIARALERFVNNERPGGKWDFKTKLSDVFDAISGTTLKNDIWGNIHYGYVGSAMGFPTSVLKAAGNVPKRDDPRDQAAIEIGAKLWRAHGLKMTKEDLLDNVRANAHKLKQN